MEYQKTFDSLVRLQKKPMAATSSLVDSRTSSGVSPVLVSITDDKRLEYEDEYTKHDPEESADQAIINSGATILDSRLILTDSSGQ